MHDAFEILGLPVNAPASEVRRAFARRVRRCHPDFHSAPTSTLTALVARLPLEPPRQDVAIDFLDVSPLVDRIQAAFFSESD